MINTKGLYKSPLLILNIQSEKIHRSKAALKEFLSYIEVLDLVACGTLQLNVDPETNMAEEVYHVINNTIIKAEDLVLIK